MKFQIENYLEQIAAPLGSMNQTYEKLIRNYHDFYLDDTRTDAAKAQKGAETKQIIQDYQKQRCDAALEVIEEIREQYQLDPPKPQKSDTQRLIDIQIWQAHLPVATVEELNELRHENLGDPDFMKLFEIEIRRRKKHEKNDPNLEVLIHRLENPVNKELEPLDNLAKMLKFIANQHYFVENMAAGVMANFQGGASYRSIDKDLALVPVDNHEAFRPVFKLGAA